MFIRLDRLLSYAAVTVSSAHMRAENYPAGGGANKFQRRRLFR